MENEEKRMISSYYEVTQSIHIGKKEVVFGIDEKEEYPYLVCYCTYDNPLSAEWVTDAVGSDDYLEAMQMFYRQGAGADRGCKSRAGTVQV